ncbi:cytoplasm protein [Sodiomyces alkalinus F11]|uniref:Cytoplasm protein n=1 Tax=Sodiomyces alkalinus (strain CBS 110278 / VKM F-3762 / F11) TaxID=1314773 RepID=A0A3N2Q3K0_SODAK|nr:cytoplasm protein [Sodiomyces alkalinus F11]ROT41322.1 cytoplasm protein [Sodiomyces alkalinus F11]
MCGIHAIVTHDGIPTLSDSLRRSLANRGPDHFGQVETRVNGKQGARLSLAFTSTVLALRGDHVTPQPFHDASTGSVLCWNGEAWKLAGQAVEGNDGEAVLARLLAAAADDDDDDDDAGGEAVLDVLRCIEGPFAFIFFDKPSSRLFYGRDRLGRRSLLVNRDDSGFVLSSVAETASPGWFEVEADGIYVVNLTREDDERGVFVSPSRRPWMIDQAADTILNIGQLNMTTPSEALPPLGSNSSVIRRLHEELTESMRMRVLHIPAPPKLEEGSNQTRVAVLFSGGLDCTVLARVASELLPQDQGIDLLNVAFENPRVALHRGQDVTTSIYEACPDRITGRKAFAELAVVCPSRKWRFVAVDVPYTETLAHRSQVIYLMHPHNTEMDLSIAYALYFAARGAGVAQERPSDAPQAYSTTARVLFSGLGADELFGGYSRHLAAFERSGYPGLVDEIKLDVSRLGKRNLGRDDRIMAHWGREVRFPYLDERLVRWAIETPIWEKCDFQHPETESRVEPGKRVLRLLAEELGMPSVAREKKRAIQFGSRTAKMESGRTKGTNLVTPMIHDGAG